MYQYISDSISLTLSLVSFEFLCAFNTLSNHWIFMSQMTFLPLTL